ncbi:E3 ubiquitin-protein ligase TRIM71-like isoform X2 [Dysidea avara]|uniref:E3 ubiquitin-protein ligase TRIM71-like isoform X2 n=1 Tax=Dysidea avara TaxID=196820 RepID=UPI0033256585
MADKQETNKNTADNLSCSLCAKFVKILRHKSDDDTDNETEVKCDDCGSDDPVVALCINCTLCLCEDCNKYHSKKNKTHDVVQLNEACLPMTTGGVGVQPKKKIFYCTKHPQKELDYYCQDCQHLICLLCSVVEHVEHTYDTVVISASKYRNELTKLIAPVETMSEKLSKAEKNLISMKHKILKQVKEINEMIDNCYTEQLTKLNEHHQQLKKQLQDELSQKEMKLTTQLEDIKSVQVQLANMKKLENIPDHKLLSKKKEDIEKSMKEVSDKYKTLNTLPIKTDSIEFVPVDNPNLLLGQLFTSAHPHTSEVVDLPRNIGYNTKVDFTIQTRNCKGEKCTKGGHHISVELKSVTGNVTIGEVKDNNDGSYVASFKGGEVGDAKLFVSINGQQIRGSPYSIVVGRNYQGINMPDEIVNDNGSMRCPWGIAFGKDGMWVVADNSNNCVYIFNGQDELVKKFDSNGSSSGKFSDPRGVTFDSDNHFYIVDGGNKRVQKFSINGNYLLQFGNDGDGKLSGPYGITTHNNKVYVADYGKEHITVFQTNGRFCTSFGSEHLRAPKDVAVNTNNQLLVVDWSNDCVVTFTLDGQYVGKFGTQGSGRGQLSGPCALAIDINGFILVADSSNRVSIFDKSGNYIDCFGSNGSNAGQFRYPYGIALSPNGSIYVSDRDNKRVQIFSNY